MDAKTKKIIGIGLLAVGIIYLAKKQSPAQTKIVTASDGLVNTGVQSIKNNQGTKLSILNQR